ncbi:uncharacterized protein LOC116609265 [Nematostella vectensis]|uniref:uncharacterized protein LOC116609265 n=1 Tax=Nematostella vectensis TaxID=45351 RepID=UPI00138FCADC|nr:uncharacterized protein LOC116609265 [Nematostella vectensis]
MRLSLIAVLLGIFASQMACGLKCYRCDSKISYQHCDKKREKIACDDATHRCIKADVSYRLHSQDIHNFRKSCVPKMGCSNNNNELCKAAPYGSSKDCKIKCCSTDLCNAGSTPLLSGLLIVISMAGLLANLRLF